LTLGAELAGKTHPAESSANIHVFQLFSKKFGESPKLS
jgi:hypothetical protein